MKLADGVRVELVGGFSSLLVVAFCSGNEIVSANCGVLGAVAASTFGRQFMVPICIFNIQNLQPLSYLCFYIITNIALQFNQVGWYFSLTAIAYFFYIEYRVGLVVALSRSLTPTILNLIIQVSLTLAKDRFIRLKSSMLYVKPKV